MRRLVAGALLLALAGCGVDDGGRSIETDGELGGTLTVFAAASLTDVFTDLGDQLTAEHPGLDVQFNFAGSSALATQVTQGAPADVLASADEEQLAAVADLGAGDPAVFAENTLVIAVPAGNPAGVTGLADLADPGLTVALCAAEVPCGAAAARVFDAAGLTPAPDTLEQDVRAALTKVQLGEVDAALVYATDVAAAGSAVEAIEVPEAADVVNRYPLMVLERAPNPLAAEAFVDLVRSDTGRQALADAGFRLP
ncbi:molybdate ABC transporter substrate-binding protein [Modestobacter sp. VKM Ac-2979]|uniref:molybdate ABC transporter substrate-binding protein n=1 Tax=unclassified Modestobacter TaxID=2643866 RepID=UPI0022ABAE38|nr:MULTISPECIES: molybdate ABC transporter substrate-binding protein [unclassified Modestobacter]MCZ2811063.1 molybdate ABC transporter substrate-binding protein [Modestobacter sp. VKM Ac-2979]MCZ2840576.1 molybdate ABC transporter substrate-binding protein [Modestobacter sp. VKM Ac-2980]